MQHNKVLLCFYARKHWLVFSHPQEMALARAEAGGQVNVCVDAAPSMDLNQAMTEIREHYEAVTEKNRKELESWYQSKVSLNATCTIHLFQNNYVIVEF